MIVEVTQADRDAAADLIDGYFSGHGDYCEAMRGLAKSLRAGHISGPWVAAFSRHRLSALEGVAGLVEALEEALGTFRITQRPENYPEEHWCNRAAAALATFREQGGW